MTDKRTDSELAEALTQCPEEFTHWKHYKTGRVYSIWGSGIDTTTGEPVVIYRALSSSWFILFVRPLREWTELVTHNGETVQRFTRVEVTDDR